MSELVSGWLLFTHGPARKFGDLIGSLRNDDWSVPQRGEEYRCLTDRDPRRMETFDEVVEVLNSAVSASITLKRKQTEVMIVRNSESDYAPPLLDNPHIKAWESEFKPYQGSWGERSRESPTRAYVDTVRRIVKELDPGYGYAKYPEYVDLSAMPHGSTLGGQLRGIFWLNVFGPDYIERVGHKRIESAPAWKVEKLDTGHYLVVASDNPVRPSEQWDGGIGEDDAIDELAAHFDVIRG